jgi:hypothetical protein
MLLTPTAHARVVINELYYDHPGSDAGYEFVELLDDDGAAVDIAGWTIEFHNGSGEGWTVLWQAPPGTSLAADRPLAVGGASVRPPAGIVHEFSLQNGPDAIRLVDAQGVVRDVVGYGGLDDPLYVEGRGTSPVEAGRSVARIPDGLDRDDNAMDFVAATPSPGGFNLPRYDAALRPAPGTPERAARTPGTSERITLWIENTALRDIDAGAVAVSFSDSSEAGVVSAGTASNRAVIAPGAVEEVDVTLPLSGGYHWIRARLSFDRDERADNDAVVLVRRARRLAVMVSEVWSAPREGCPQFVELYNAGGDPVVVTGWRLRDTRARAVPLDGDSLVIASRGWLAVSANAEELRGCVPAAGVVAGVDGSWPSFNKSGDAVADSVVVSDRYGIAVEAVAYPGLASGVSGRSLERVDLYPGTPGAVWRLSPSLAGCSPGLPNEASLYAPPPGGEIDVSPNPFAPASGDVLRIAVSADGVVSRVSVAVFDVNGRRVANVGSAGAVPVVFLWDGRDASGAPVRPGIYVVTCEIVMGDGSRGAVLKAVVGCAGREP